MTLTAGTSSRHTTEDDTGDVRVLFIAGVGRSGSTLLCRTLGSVEGFLGTGELMRVLSRGVMSGDFCSCGTSVQSCALWGRVLQDLMRRCPNLDVERLERTRTRVTEGWESLRYLFLPAGDSALERDLTEYRHFLSALYRSIRDTTGARVIVDASKSFVFAKLLTQTPGVRVSVVHLVRDSRGVAHSLMRKRERPGTQGRQEHFPQRGALLGAIIWSAAHITAEWLGRWATRVIRVRYEDFVANPSSTVGHILRTLVPDSGAASLAHLNGGAVRLGVDHLIASNPNRSRRGEIELNEDVAWRHQMSLGHQWLVTGLTYPLLRRYGYRVLGPPAAAARPDPVPARQAEP